MRNVVLGSFFLLSMPLQADSGFDSGQIQQRVSHVGQVHLVQTDQPAASRADEPEMVAGEKSAGQATYEQYCVTCHQDGVAGAPKLHDPDDWKPRQAKQSIDDLVASATKGLNAMPAKGTCQDCSASDLKAAIEYMLPTP